MVGSAAPLITMMMMMMMCSVLFLLSYHHIHHDYIHCSLLWFYIMMNIYRHYHRSCYGHHFSKFKIQIQIQNFYLANEETT